MTFDAAGIVAVGCMDCGIVMKRRVFSKVPIVDQKKTLLGYQKDEEGNTIVVARLVRTRDYNEQKVSLRDQSFARIFRCVECCAYPLDLKKVTRQIKLAWVQEMTQAGRTISERKDVLKTDMQVQGVL